MIDLYVKALLAFVEVLDIHIDTKTSENEVVHRKTAEFYEALFDMAHEIGERAVDLGGQVRKDTGDLGAQTSRVLEILTTLKKDIEGAITGTSQGTTNLLAGHADKLEFLIGTATGLTKACGGKGGVAIVVGVEDKATTKDDKSKDSKKEKPVKGIEGSPEEEASESPAEEKAEEDSDLEEVEHAIAL